MCVEDVRAEHFGIGVRKPYKYWVLCSLLWMISYWNNAMSCLRVILTIIFRPLSVIDYGCGSVLIVFILTLAGWVPGVIAALIILNRARN